MTTDPTADGPTRRRNPAPYLLVAVAAVLGCYSLVVVLSGLRTAT